MCIYTHTRGENRSGNSLAEKFMCPGEWALARSSRKGIVVCARLRWIIVRTCFFFRAVSAFFVHGGLREKERERERETGRGRERQQQLFSGHRKRAAGGASERRRISAREPADVSYILARSSRSLPRRWSYMAIMLTPAIFCFASIVFPLLLFSLLGIDY